MKAAALNRPAKASRPADSAGFVAWLDALVAGTCTEDEVLAHVQRLEESDRDVAWECLAQLDQQFRRKRIPQPLFASLKSRLQKHSLGVRVNAAVMTPAAAPAQAPSPAPAVPQAPAASRVARAPEAPAVRMPPPAAPAASPSAARPAPLRGEPDQIDEESLAPRALRVGDVLRGRYRLVDVISEDESGTLYESIDELNLGVPGSRPRVAIRVIANEPARMPERLRRLGRVQALSHPGIVRVFNVDEERGNVFVTMELPSGSTLRHVLDRTHAPLATPAALAVVRTIAGALAYAHSQGVQHGDIRAEQVFLDRAGEARLGGFEKNDDAAASVDGDRLAFAWFAYGLLSGTPGSLRAPPGLTRAQWHALRDTLSGNRGPRAANLLPLLAGDDRSAPVASAAATPPPRRLVLNDWIAIAVVAAIFAGGAALVVRENARSDAGPASAAPGVNGTGVGTPPQQQAAAVPPAPAPTSAPAEAARATQAPQPLPAPAAAAAVTQTPPPASAAEPVGAPVFAQARMYFPVNFLEVSADEPVARLWVRRQGRMSGTASFRWWTESGTAETDRHFRRIAPVVAEIPAGARGVELVVPLVPGAVLDRPRTFYVRIDEPDARSTLGDEVLMQVVIVPPARAENP